MDMDFIRKYRFLIAAILVILVVVAGFAVRQLMRSPSVPGSTSSDIVKERATREITLYFGAPDANQLLPEAREIDECLAEEACVQATVQTLIAGPLSPLVPVLPPSTTLLGVVVRDNTAELNFSRELVNGHPGGSISELLTVYALANTVAANFPHLRQIRLLVEGESVETLKGHFGLREAIRADFTYIRPAEVKTRSASQPERPVSAAAGENRP